MNKVNFISILCTIVLLTSCAGKTSDNKQDAKENNQQLTIGVMSSMDYLPLAVAEREGYFKQEGIDVKIEKFYSANERDAAFQSGNIDGTVIDYTGAILQKAEEEYR